MGQYPEASTLLILSDATIAKRIVFGLEKPQKALGVKFSQVKLFVKALR
jgi:hypothetical protein